MIKRRVLMGSCVVPSSGTCADRKQAYRLEKRNICSSGSAATAQTHDQQQMWLLPSTLWPEPNFWQISGQQQQQQIQHQQHQYTQMQMSRQLHVQQQQQQYQRQLQQEQQHFHQQQQMLPAALSPAIHQQQLQRQTVLHPYIPKP